MVTLAPIPADEAARLSDLHDHQILDTPADERFDLFTRLGCWLFDLPLSAINLVDAERTFFKSVAGFEAFEARRARSICAHAVGCGEAVMVVEDLALDRRFVGDPLLAQGVRFYAGAVLRSAAGHGLGTLCVAGVQPRAFSLEERWKLRELAKGVGAVLELHRSSLAHLHAATHDALTGLRNRRYLSERLQQAAEKARAQQPCALLCIDLDHFKAINDRHGHAGGDAVLCEAGRRLTALVREGDIVARLGGDEFVVLLEPAARPQAGQLAQRILAAFAAPFAFAGEAVAIRGSVGIAVCPGDAATPDALLRHADAALYAAKRRGRARSPAAPSVVPRPRLA